MSSVALRNDTLIEISTFLIRRWSENDKIIVTMSPKKVNETRMKENKERGLTKNTKGLVITKIANDSPINYLQEGNIIVEAQKKAIRTVADLETAVSTALKSNEKTLLLVIFNNQNQRRYIGVKLN